MEYNNYINKQFIITKLTELKPILEQKYHVKKLGFFGSFARNEQTDKSDIDIIVEYESGTDNLYEIEM